MANLMPGIVAVIMFSGSVIFMAAANRFHWQTLLDRSPPPPPKPKKKKVRFSDSVVEPKGDSREFRKKRASEAAPPAPAPEVALPPPPPTPPPISKKVAALLGSSLPANRIALYSDRYHDRLLKV